MTAFIRACKETEDAIRRVKLDEQMPAFKAKANASCGLTLAKAYMHLGTFRNAFARFCGVQADAAEVTLAIEDCARFGIVVDDGKISGFTIAEATLWSPFLQQLHHELFPETETNHCDPETESKSRGKRKTRS